jgi:hypothetical protein
MLSQLSYSPYFIRPIERIGSYAFDGYVVLWAQLDLN